MSWVLVVVGSEAGVGGGRGWDRDESVGAGGANVRAKAIATSTNKVPVLIRWKYVGFPLATYLCVHHRHWILLNGPNENSICIPAGLYEPMNLIIALPLAFLTALSDCEDSCCDMMKHMTWVHLSSIRPTFLYRYKKCLDSHDSFLWLVALAVKLFSCNSTGATWCDWWNKSWLCIHLFPSYPIAQSNYTYTQWRPKWTANLLHCYLCTNL